MNIYIILGISLLIIVVGVTIFLTMRKKSKECKTDKDCSKGEKCMPNMISGKSMCEPTSQSTKRNCDFEKNLAHCKLDKDCDDCDGILEKRCVSVTSETPYVIIDTEGNRYSLPNSQDGYGWCLPYFEKGPDCNPLVSDRVIQKIVKDGKTSYKWICQCKYPGLVDKNTTDGTCSVVRACENDQGKTVGKYYVKIPGSKGNDKLDDNACINEREEMFGNVLTLLRTSDIGFDGGDGIYESIKSQSIPNYITSIKWTFDKYTALCNDAKNKDNKMCYDKDNDVTPENILKRNQETLKQPYLKVALTFLLEGLKALKAKDPKVGWDGVGIGIITTLTPPFNELQQIKQLKADDGKYYCFIPYDTIIGRNVDPTFGRCLCESGYTETSQPGHRYCVTDTCQPNGKSENDGCKCNDGYIECSPRNDPFKNVDFSKITDIEVSNQIKALQTRGKSQSFCIQDICAPGGKWSQEKGRCICNDGFANKGVKDSAQPLPYLCRNARDDCPESIAAGYKIENVDGQAEQDIYCTGCKCPYELKGKLCSMGDKLLKGTQCSRDNECCSGKCKPDFLRKTCS